MVESIKRLQAAGCSDAEVAETLGISIVKVEEASKQLTIVEQQDLKSAEMSLDLATIVDRREAQEGKGLLEICVEELVSVIQNDENGNTKVNAVKALADLTMKAKEKSEDKGNNDAHEEFTLRWKRTKEICNGVGDRPTMETVVGNLMGPSRVN